MGSGSEPQEDLALPLGRMLARLGVHLLTGGGGGVMESVSRGFCSVEPRTGLCLGVLPAGDRTGYPNPWIELAIRTHLPLSGEQGTDVRSRNHINVLTADVLVFLPGSAGTRSEAELAVHYGRPACAIGRTPRLHEGIERVRTLGEVEAFVASRLGRTG